MPVCNHLSPHQPIHPQKHTHTRSHTHAVAQPVESCLLATLPEHLNAEVVLGTVQDIPAAVSWVKSTFLFARVYRNPQHYGCAGVHDTGWHRAGMGTRAWARFRFYSNLLEPMSRAGGGVLPPSRCIML